MLSVSIHAPARGATSNPRGKKTKITGFNPRPRAGGDPWYYNAKLCPRCFNPRPRAGGDDCRRMHVRENVCFNPRPRAGGDEHRIMIVG